MSSGKVHLEANSVADLISNAYQHAYEEGWTDGLPIIPATTHKIADFVAASGRAKDEVVGIMPPRKGPATIEAIAINAVMAGCRPEYMPLIVAAVEALSDRGFPLEMMQVTTNPMTPFLLVNGPIRKKIDLNCGTGCLGPGWRANATIGRAVRLSMINIGGALPGVYSKSTFASPMRYSFICGENEEDSPWKPFHVSRGHSAGESTVTVFRAANYSNISGGEGTGHEEILRQIATSMPPIYGGGGGVLLLLGINHAHALHEAGLSKDDIRQRLWELARLPHDYFAKSFIEMELGAGRGDAKTLWRTRTPDEFYIAAAGGPGPQNVYIGAGMPQTRLIRGVA